MSLLSSRLNSTFLHSIRRNNSTMAKHLQNKVAIVTGSTAGIGYAIARRLGNDGAKVVISSRKPDNVDKAVKTLRAEGITADGTACNVGVDVDRQKLIDFTLSKYGRIDLLINNAGINPHFGDLLDCSDKIWDKLFDVNVKAGFVMSKMCVPHMVKAGGGNIIFVSSVAGYTLFPGISAYGVTKTALLGLTKAMAHSCAKHNIRVNCIAPGIIKTDFSKALWENATEDETVKSMIPMGRYGTADDCAGAVSFFCSDSAQYITGEVIGITGGINCRL